MQHSLQRCVGCCYLCHFEMSSVAAYVSAQKWIMSSRLRRLCHAHIGPHWPTLALHMALYTGQDVGKPVRERSSRTDSCGNNLCRHRRYTGRAARARGRGWRQPVRGGVASDDLRAEAVGSTGSSAGLLPMPGGTHSLLRGVSVPHEHNINVVQSCIPTFRSRAYMHG